MRPCAKENELSNESTSQHSWPEAAVPQDRGRLAGCGETGDTEEETAGGLAEVESQFSATFRRLPRFSVNAVCVKYILPK